MSRQFVKILVLVLSLMLLYYGVAWSVLRCVHDEGSNYDVILFNSNPIHLDIECIGPNFHTEAMATASSPSQGDRLLPEITHSVNDFLTLRTWQANAESNAWLRAVFELSLLLAFLIGLPPYLSLYVLRI